MADQRRRPAVRDYDRNVFINCPFDDSYDPLFRALVFTVFDCGLVPRCAKEAYDSGSVRIEKIIALIRQCRFGIHDISRTEVNEAGLPRFNMPLELGLFLGAAWFGAAEQRRKSCLILDRDKFRYQAYISDIAGQDIHAHANQPDQAIRAARDWLVSAKAPSRDIPSSTDIARRYAQFQSELPAICVETRRLSSELTFVEFAAIAERWLRRELALAAGPLEGAGSD